MSQHFNYNWNYGGLHSCWAPGLWSCHLEGRVFSSPVTRTQTRPGGSGCQCLAPSASWGQWTRWERETPPLEVGKGRKRGEGSGRDGRRSPCKRQEAGAWVCEWSGARGLCLARYVPAACAMCGLRRCSVAVRGGGARSPALSGALPSYSPDVIPPCYVNTDFTSSRPDLIATDRERLQAPCAL